jgi:hypothetical protein
MVKLITIGRCPKGISTTQVFPISACNYLELRNGITIWYEFWNLPHKVIYVLLWLKIDFLKKGMCMGSALNRLSQSLRGRKRRSQKFHPTYKISCNTQQANGFLINRKFSQQSIKPTISSSSRDFIDNSNIDWRSDFLWFSYGDWKCVFVDFLTEYIHHLHYVSLLSVE